MKKIIKSKLLILFILAIISIGLIACGSTNNDNSTSIPSTSTTNTTNTSTSYIYVGSSKSDKYHLPSCTWAEKIKSSNLVEFTSKEDADSKGYQPCKVCKP
ncbi:hypothetical protein K9O30_06200 [Clostridium bowmanii]|uniref:Ada metal-binding domain-containing protein n=1 Tax=Clostridium bowmanii TaxID=132925 RepID=UPI001C0DEA47|nr:Ada metal-binding domain-containing protein [Clostridium bowmanii]MBU3188751.1 hypothetical protein [Clostridium bowmanii]MCA1073336.1 hypothetical protein [Clostridium bowmanii]